MLPLRRAACRPKDPRRSARRTSRGRCQPSAARETRGTLAAGIIDERFDVATARLRGKRPDVSRGSRTVADDEGSHSFGEERSG